MIIHLLENYTFIHFVMVVMKMIYCGFDHSI